jgi:ABC-type sulfate/molybdate transport systems ATPase subunit
VLKLDIGKQLGVFRLQAAFDAPSRGATVVFGPSGAGKSALLTAIAGLQRPDQGLITLDGDTLFDSARGSEGLAAFGLVPDSDDFLVDFLRAGLAMARSLRCTL